MNEHAYTNERTNERRSKTSNAVTLLHYPLDVRQHRSAESEKNRASSSHRDTMFATLSVVVVWWQAAHAIEREERRWW